MNPGPAAGLSAAERGERYRLLREATAPRPAPVITAAGLRLLLDSATAPQAGPLPDESLRLERDQLVQAGLIGGDGWLNPAAADVVEAVRRPHVELQAEVAAGESVRVFKAWLGYRRAVILAQPSPAITAADGPRDIAGRTPPTLDGYQLQVVVPGWVPVAAARWLGFGPRESPAGSGRLPRPALLRRLADPGAPLPGAPLPGAPAPGAPAPGDDQVLARIWAQPMQLCALTVQPSRYRTLVLDAAGAGLWLLAEEDPGTAVLTPLPAHAAWRLLLTLITRAGRAGRAGLL